MDDAIGDVEYMHLGDDGRAKVSAALEAVRMCLCAPIIYTMDVSEDFWPLTVGHYQHDHHYHGVTL
jgi:hypothetical protein